MHDLHIMIVSYLLGPLITGRPIDCEDLARFLQTSFPDVPLRRTYCNHQRRSVRVGRWYHEYLRSEPNPLNAVPIAERLRW